METNIPQINNEININKHEIESPKMNVPRPDINCNLSPINELINSNIINIPKLDINEHKIDTETNTL